ncbi:flotillin-2a-like isoform X1 [Oncorhynchus kisutch]|uniref:Flotillin n=1 Tax=Oncorhynchus kisutch TaxID=8019 RepID=A0A8C7N0U7_ONCKI|nr:flotillin-2a-like isoform X1 [Oncorhynchus kisutch]
MVSCQANQGKETSRASQGVKARRAGLGAPGSIDGGILPDVTNKTKKFLDRLGEQELTIRLRPDVGWAPSEPTGARKPLEPARVWNPDELARHPWFHRWRLRADVIIPTGMPVLPDASCDGGCILSHGIDAGETKQVKVMVDNELLGYACEQFLGKSVMEIKSVILQTLEGHLRSILGTLTVEQIYQDRDRFAALVREVAAPDVGHMGIEILSFTIKDVYDKVEYLSSLGKSQTAAVQRDADIGVAEAGRDAGIREAECKKEMMDIKFQADTKMADSKRGLEMQKAAFNQEVNTKKAEAQLAYELQAAKEQQKIRLEEIEIEVVQRKKQITIEEKEIDRTEKELIATVKRPAESEAYKMQQLAEGQKMKKVLTAQAEAEKIRRIGEAEAGSIEAIGKAEAEKMRLKAEAYQHYGEAAKTALVLEALPKIAGKVAAPLAQTNEIVILSGDGSRVTGEVNRLLAELPVSVNALTGVDLMKIPFLQKMTNPQA